jgi:hypothetical protein
LETRNVEDEHAELVYSIQALQIQFHGLSTEVLKPIPQSPSLNYNYFGRSFIFRPPATHTRREFIVATGTRRDMYE